MDQFLLFGDSLTQQSFSEGGIGAALSDAYVRRLDVVNRGYSGYNAIQALHILDKVIPSPNVARLRFLTIWLGANDSVLRNAAGTPQHVPQPEYVAALRKIVKHPSVKAHTGVRIILITPPAVESNMQEALDRVKWPGMNGVRRSAEITGAYATAARNLAEELDIACLDIWSVMVEAASKSANSGLPGSRAAGRNETLASLMHDGLHFTPKGYRLVFDKLMALIERTWPDQMPDKLAYVLPQWDHATAWQGVYP